MGLNSLRRSVSKKVFKFILLFVSFPSTIKLPLKGNLDVMFD